ncbi:MAG TPA: hypothetical protein VGV38_18765 [Pyrinomonadaceae bacterium]|nr:hypothetical protein [Pyrinomonadaceae bacterium]
MACLSPDPAEAGRRYTRLHKRLAGFFRMKGVSDPERAADDTIDRAARKISEGTPVPDADKYCLGVARNVAKEEWRREQRESSVFAIFLQNLSNNSDEEVERIQLVLKPCFEELSTDERELLVAYCGVLHGRARAEHRRRLAELRKTTVLALRMRVTRLRNALTLCAERRLAEGLA